jgi:hypothetical protein
LIADPFDDITKYNTTQPPPISIIGLENKEDKLLAPPKKFLNIFEKLPAMFPKKSPTPLKALALAPIIYIIYTYILI